MNWVWAAPVACVGPIWSQVALISSHAFLAPLNAASKYGWLICLGITAIFRPDLIPPAPACADAEPESVPEPELEHATRVASAATAMVTRTRVVRIADSLWTRTTAV